MLHHIGLDREAAYKGDMSYQTALRTVCQCNWSPILVRDTVYLTTFFPYQRSMYFPLSVDDYGMRNDIVLVSHSRC